MLYREIIAVSSEIHAKHINALRAEHRISECHSCRLRVFGNRVLRRVFGHKRDEVRGEWRKLHKEELRDLYSLPNIVRVVKSRRMR